MIRLDDPSGCHQVGRVAKPSHTISYRDPDPMRVFVSSVLALAMLASAVWVAVS